MIERNVGVRLARLLMNLFPAVPVPPDQTIQDLGEIFRHRAFVRGSEAEKDDIMHKSSTFFYEDEMSYPWDNYFATSLADLLQDLDVLDVGSMVGGRDAAWFERYHLRKLTGLEVREIGVEAARRFARRKGINAQYVVGIGESIPFEDERFDAILSFETFEHVQDLAKVMSECYRVLKPEGRLFVVFPGYFHPTSHHLGLATWCPGIQWLFTGRTLVNAYYDVLKERGDSASWYNRSRRDLDAWEKGNTINGTTAAGFAKIVNLRPWRVVLQGRIPIGTVGRNICTRKALARICTLLLPLTFVPLLQEVFLHRITYVLEKRK
jgi:SAM-dependent methyltransferase